MDKVGLLCEKDRLMLYEFSRRSLDGLKERSLMSVALSLFSRYMDANIRKEVEKDQLIIEESASAFDAGRSVCDLDIEDIFEKTKAIDKSFVDRLALPGLSFSLRYSDFADIRIRRIWRIARTVYALLKKWGDAATVSEAVRKTYTEKEFKEILIEILHLYNLETRMLAEALHSPFRKTITAYLESLFKSMESAMEQLASSCVKTTYGDRIVHA